MPKVSIYVLADPRFPQTVRYVGATPQKLSSRLQQHWSSSIQSDSPRAMWIRGLREIGLRPIISLVEKCEENWQDRERFWIKFYRRSGLLTNQTDGGLNGGGWKHKPETIESYRSKRVGLRPNELNRLITAPLLAACNEARKKKVLCLETGEVFDSIEEAARRLGKRPEHFRDNIRNGYKTRGKTFQICQQPFH